jgi:hypothetical protein
VVLIKHEQSGEDGVDHVVQGSTCKEMMDGDESKSSKARVYVRNLLSPV